MGMRPPWQIGRSASFHTMDPPLWGSVPMKVPWTARPPPQCLSGCQIWPLRMFPSSFAFTGVGRQCPQSPELPGHRVLLLLLLELFPVPFSSPVARRWLWFGKVHALRVHSFLRIQKGSRPTNGRHPSAHGSRLEPGATVVGLQKAGPGCWPGRLARNFRELNQRSHLAPPAGVYGSLSVTDKRGPMQQANLGAPNSSGMARNDRPLSLIRIGGPRHFAG